MHTTYHLNSAEDLTSDIMEAIKIAYKTKPITIMVEESYVDELTEEQMAILDERLAEDPANDIDAADALAILKSKFEL